MKRQSIASRRSLRLGRRLGGEGERETFSRAPLSNSSTPSSHYSQLDREKHIQSLPTIIFYLVALITPAHKGDTLHSAPFLSFLAHLTPSRSSPNLPRANHPNNLHRSTKCPPASACALRKHHDNTPGSPPECETPSSEDFKAPHQTRPLRLHLRAFSRDYGRAKLA